MKEIFNIPATMHFCEEILKNGLAQPANSISSFAFLILACIFLYDFLKSRKTLIIVFSINAIFIGIFSFFFHATNSYFGQLLDLSSMFVLAATIICLNLQVILKPKLKYLLTLFFLLNILSLILTIIFGYWSGAFVFSILILIGIVTELKTKTFFKKIDYKFLFLGLLILVVSFIIWITDTTGFFCDPKNHIINGHTIWHIFDTVSLYFMYRFYLGKFRN